MINSAVVSNSSKTYANALFMSALEKCIQEKILNQFEEVCSAVKKSEDFCEVISNPSIEVSVKHKIIDEVFESSVEPILLNFVKILADKNRFSEIYSIFVAYKNLYDCSLNKKNIEVLSAVNLSDDVKSKIELVLKKKLNSDVIVSWTVDEEIIAGLIFKFDDYVIDTSIKTKLDEMSKNLLR